jgi:hypothetical protein
MVRLLTCGIASGDAPAKRLTHAVDSAFAARRKRKAIQTDFSERIVRVTCTAASLGSAIARAFGQTGATFALNALALDRVEHAIA